MQAALYNVSLWAQNDLRCRRAPKPQQTNKQTIMFHLCNFLHISMAGVCLMLNFSPNRPPVCATRLSWRVSLLFRLTVYPRPPRSAGV